MQRTMEESKGRILAIDYGEARIGLAITDEMQIIVSPLEVVKPKKQDPVKRISEIVQEMDVTEIVLGMPYLLSGKEGRVAEQVKKFKEELEKNLTVPVVLHDERFTSKMAEMELRSRGIKPSRNKEKIDLFAAGILLEDYLEFKRRRSL